MTSRIDGQVGFEEIKATAASVPEGAMREIIIAQWALARFGRHHKHCNEEIAMSSRVGCDCGLDWARQRLGIEHNKNMTTTEAK